MFFKKKKDTRTPHDIFPEIIDWKRHDTILLYGITEGNFVKVTEDGNIILDSFGDYKIYHITEAKRMINRDLKTRRIKDKYSEDRYQQFINDFQAEYNKIRFKSVS